MGDRIIFIVNVMKIIRFFIANLGKTMKNEIDT